ncbi:hypothetical protein ACFE04_021978 [Oxalis oulophora]
MSAAFLLILTLLLVVSLLLDTHLRDQILIWYCVGRAKRSALHKRCGVDTPSLFVISHRLDVVVSCIYYSLSLIVSALLWVVYGRLKKCRLHRGNIEVSFRGYTEVISRGKLSGNIEVNFRGYNRGKLSGLHRGNIEVSFRGYNRGNIEVSFRGYNRGKLSGLHRGNIEVSFRGYNRGKLSGINRGKLSG